MQLAGQKCINLDLMLGSRHIIVPIACSYNMNDLTTQIQLPYSPILGHHSNQIMLALSWL